MIRRGMGCEPLYSYVKKAKVDRACNHFFDQIKFPDILARLFSVYPLDLFGISPDVVVSFASNCIHIHRI